MTVPGYEYWGLMAETWDLLRGDTSNWVDRFFYLELIQREGQPVLDVGCASGRILLDFLQQGIDIDGVDNSPELLAIGKRKAAGLGLNPSLTCQSMQTLNLPRRYQVILVPSSSFQLLTDPADARAALARFHAHLRAGGVLAMPFMDLWRSGEPLDSGMALSSEKVRPQDGATVRHWSRSFYDPSTQLESSDDSYEILVDGMVIQSEEHTQAPATRGYSLQQAVALLTQAGFVDVCAWSGFTWEPATESDRLFTLTGRKATQESCDVN